MLSKNEIKKISSLTHKKYRLQYGLFLVEGVKSVLEAVKCQSYQVEHIIATADMIGNIPNEYRMRITVAESKILSQISSQKTASGIIAVVKIPTTTFSPEMLSMVTPVLDNISDPGNLGTIIRTADWFGIQHIICSLNSVDLYNPKTIQATMGSFTRVKVHYFDLQELLPKISSQFDIVGLDMHGININQYQIKRKTLLITGNEANGISQEVKKEIKTTLSIPYRGDICKEKPESLNASICTAIACYALIK